MIVTYFYRRLMEKTPLTKELERVFTIDGRGTPKKCKLLLELIQTQGQEVIFEEIRKISERKF
jgi:hypothetical protein